MVSPPLEFELIQYEVLNPKTDEKKDEKKEQPQVVKNPPPDETKEEERPKSPKIKKGLARPKPVTHSLDQEVPKEVAPFDQPMESAEKEADNRPPPYEPPGRPGDIEEVSKGPSHEILRDDYLGSIRAKIEANKDYPLIARRQHWQGKVTLRFLINENLRAEQIKVLFSSGYQVLDTAAVNSVEKASPFPPPPVPHLLPLSVELTVIFQLR